ncbi:hypothetical protein OAQ01_01665, partial [Emcibacteraceae bacterium]|nr:hypothetical protein [Emcibacteraceae bacterium]
MNVKKYLPIALLVSGLLLAIYFDVHKLLSFEVIGENYSLIKNYIDEQFLLSIIIFAAGYALIVAFSIPGASVLSLMYGALLGTVVSGFLVVISATIGASMIFLAARYAFADTLKERAGPWLSKMQDGF